MVHGDGRVKADLRFMAGVALGHASRHRDVNGRLAYRRG